jgi:NitT/TauT family transport system permease protein
VRRALDTAILIALLLALWHLLAVTTTEALVTPWQTFERVQRHWASARFWPHVWETLTAFGWSLLWALVGGLAIGVPLGLNRLGRAVAEPILVSIYSLPKITLYPVILLAFGLGMPAKVAFGTIHGIFPVALFAMNAVANVAPVYLRTARVMRLSYPVALRTVVIPAAIPEIVSGLRIGFSLTLLGVLIGEMFASQRGLGFLLMNAIGLHDIETMLSVILQITVFAVLGNAALLWIDKRLHARAH